MLLPFDGRHEQVTLTRNNVKEGDTVPPVYAPKYPLFADEGWWVLVGDTNRKTIFSFERMTDNGRVVSKEVCILRAAMNSCLCCVRVRGWGARWGGVALWLVLLVLCL